MINALAASPSNSPSCVPVEFPAHRSRSSDGERGLRPPGRPAKEKKQNRREVLRAANLDVTKLPNIDYVDAALCALAADHLLRGSFKAYGTADDGFIVVPQIPKPPAAHSATQ